MGETRKYKLRFDEGTVVELTDIVQEEGWSGGWVRLYRADGSYTRVNYDRVIMMDVVEE